MASSEDICESNANFAIICSFITKFGNDCGVQVTISSLKEMLEDTKNEERDTVSAVSEELKEILIHLLRKGKKRVTKERWERALVKFCHEYSSVDAWEIERFGYKKAKLSVKLELLKRLLELQFDCNAKFKTEVNKLDASALRVLPIGRDIDGHMYWYQLDKDCNMRLYKQDVEDENSWQLLCSTKEELQGVIGSLGKKTSIQKDVSKVLKYDPLPISTDKVPTDTEDEPQLKKENQENLIEHEDLKASISLTNPCAIIIKTEKKEANLASSEKIQLNMGEKHAEKSNQSTDSVCSEPKSDISVIESRTLKKVGLSSETSDNSSQIKTCLKTECKSLPAEDTSPLKPLPAVKMEVDNPSTHTLTTCESKKKDDKISASVSKQAINSLCDTESHIKVIDNEIVPMETQTIPEIIQCAPAKVVFPDPLKGLKEMSSKLEDTRTLPLDMSIINNKDSPGTNYKPHSAKVKTENSAVSDRNTATLSPVETITHQTAVIQEESECKVKGSKMKLYEKWSNEKKKLAAAHMVTSIVPEKSVALQELNSDADVVKEFKNKSPILERNAKTPPAYEPPLKPISLTVDAKGCVQFASVISPNCGSLLQRTSDVDMPTDLSRPVICHTSTPCAEQCLPHSTDQRTLVNNAKNSNEMALNYALPNVHHGNDLYIFPEKKSISNSEQLVNNSKVICSTEHMLSRPFKKKHLLMSEGSQCTKDSVEPCRHSVICEVKNNKLVSPKVEESLASDDHAATSCVINSDKTVPCKDSLSANKQNISASKSEKGCDSIEVNPPPPQIVSHSSSTIVLPVTSPSLEDKAIICKKSLVMTDHSVASLIADSKPKAVVESTSVSNSQGENTTASGTEQPSVIKPLKNQKDSTLSTSTSVCETNSHNAKNTKETLDSVSKHYNSNGNVTVLDVESSSNTEKILKDVSDAVVNADKPICELKVHDLKSSVPLSSEDFETNLKTDIPKESVCENTEFSAKEDTKCTLACSKTIEESSSVNNAHMFSMQKPSVDSESNTSDLCENTSAMPQNVDFNSATEHTNSFTEKKNISLKDDASYDVKNTLSEKQSSNDKNDAGKFNVNVSSPSKSTDVTKINVANISKAIATSCVSPQSVKDESCIESTSEGNTKEASDVVKCLPISDKQIASESNDVDKVQVMSAASSSQEKLTSVKEKASAQNEAEEKASAHSEVEGKAFVQSETEVKASAQSETEVKASAQGEAEEKASAQSEAKEKASAWSKAKQKASAQSEAEEKASTQSETTEKASVHNETVEMATTQSETVEKASARSGIAEQADHGKITKSSSLQGETKERTSMSNETAEMALMQSETAEKGFTQSETAEKGFTQSETIEKGFTQSETAEKGFTQSETIEKGFTQSETIKNASAQGETAEKSPTQAENKEKPSTQDETKEKAFTQSKTKNFSVEVKPLEVKSTKEEKSVPSNSVTDCSSVSELANETPVTTCEPRNPVIEENKGSICDKVQTSVIDACKVNPSELSKEEELSESCKDSIVKHCAIKSDIEGIEESKKLVLSSETDNTCVPLEMQKSTACFSKEDSITTEEIKIPEKVTVLNSNSTETTGEPTSDPKSLLQVVDETEKNSSHQSKGSLTNEVNESLPLSSQESALHESEAPCDLSLNTEPKGDPLVTSKVKDPIVESEKTAASDIKNISCKSSPSSNCTNETIGVAIQDQVVFSLKKEKVDEKISEVKPEILELKDEVLSATETTERLQKEVKIASLQSSEEVDCASHKIPAIKCTESEMLVKDPNKTIKLSNENDEPVCADLPSEPLQLCSCEIDNKTIPEDLSGTGNDSGVTKNESITEKPVIAKVTENQDGKTLLESSKSLKENFVKTALVETVEDEAESQVKDDLKKAGDTSESVTLDEKVKILGRVDTEDSLIKSDTSSETSKEASIDQEMSDNPPDLTPNIALNDGKIKHYAGISSTMKTDLKDNSESSDISNDIPILDKQISDDTSTDDSKLLTREIPECKTKETGVKAMSKVSESFTGLKKSPKKKESVGSEKEKGSSTQKESQETDVKNEKSEIVSDIKSTEDSKIASCDKIKNASADMKITFKGIGKKGTLKAVKIQSKPPDKENAQGVSEEKLEESSVQVKDDSKLPEKTPTTRSQGRKRKRGRKPSSTPAGNSQAKLPEVTPVVSENTLISDDNQPKITFKMDFFDDTENLDLKNFPFNVMKGFDLQQKILTPKSTAFRNKYGPEDSEEIIKNVCIHYTSNMHNHCCETKHRNYAMNYDDNNFAFKVKHYHRLGLELPVLKSEPPAIPPPPVASDECRTTRGRSRRAAEPKPSYVPPRKLRNAKGKTLTPVKSVESTPGKNTPDFIPEGFLEILGNKKTEEKSEKESTVIPTKGRRGRSSKVVVIPSSESESTSQSLPIKRSRRIQEQHEKKMSELAVEMQKEHRRLEQLAKKNTNQNKKSAPEKINEKVTPAKVTSKSPVTKFQPPETEDACLEAKRPRRKRKTVMNMAKLALMYDDESKDSEQSTSRSTEKSRRRRCARGKKKGFKPWDVSSESETSVEEVTEEEEEEEIEEPLVFTINDDEFACEEVEEDEEPVVVRRARTAKKDEGEDVVLDDKPCGKCGKHDRPEWILLCDNCDDGYHTSCLVPPLLNIPDGDWYCQPCEHLLLCECLTRELQKLDQLLKQKEREELRKQRLAYVGISLDNVLKPEKKESESSSEAHSIEEPAKEKKIIAHKSKHRETSDEDKKKLFGKRSSRSRQKVNYQFKEYDELIASAIQDDMFDIKMAEEFVPPEKEENSDDDEDDDSYTGPKNFRTSRRKRKSRRLNDLDFSDADDSGDDYKGLSTDTEHTPSANTEVSMSGSNASGEWRIVKSKPKRKSRRSKRGKYSSSEEDAQDSDGSNYRPTTRRAAQKQISYRELSSEDEWEELPKKTSQKRKKKFSTSDDTSESSSFNALKTKKKPKTSKKWEDSTSASESAESSASADSSSTRQSTSEWKIQKKSSEGGGIKININKKQADSDSGSSSKKSQVKKRINRLVSDDSNEDDDDEEESSDEEETDDDESSESSDKSEPENSKHSDTKKVEKLAAPNIKKAPSGTLPINKVKSNMGVKPNVVNTSSLKLKATSENKPKTATKVAPHVSKDSPNAKTSSEKGQPVGSQVRVAKLPNVVGIPKNVTVCRAVTLNREQVSSSQIVVKTVVVKTVPKGAIKEIKMVPSKIPYKDKIDSNDTENKKSAPFPKDAVKRPTSNSPAPNSPNLKATPSVKPPITKVVSVNLQSSPKTTSIISNVLSGKVFSNPVLEQQRFNPIKQQQQLSPKSISHQQFPPGMPDPQRHHPMQQNAMVGPSIQHPQRFPNPNMEHVRGGHPMQQPMPVRNIGPSMQRFPNPMMETQIRSHPAISINHPMHPQQMPINRPPHPGMPIGGPPRAYSSPVMEHQGPNTMQQSMSIKTVPPPPPQQQQQQQQSYSGSIVEPFSTADIDQGSDSRDEVPLEKIPSASNSPPVELIPNKGMSYDKESEYRPAKETANFPYGMQEEKGFPAAYSPLSSLQEFTSRPSPLKPSLVETYPSNSASPTRLTSLDSYSQTNSPKGFISLDTYSQSRKKAGFSNSPSESGMIPRSIPPGDHYQGEARFPQEPYPCQSSPGSYQQRSSTPQQQRDPGTPPRLYSQFSDSYAPPRSPEFYQNQQQFYPMEEGMPRSGYQPNYTPSDNVPSYSYMPNAMQQPNDGFMIDTILRARNEEDELSNVSGIVQYITQQ